MLSSRLLKPSWLPASLTRVRAASTGTRPKELIQKQELKKEEPRPLYMDFQATTPMDPRVLDAMLPYQVNLYGNPHSRTHAYGWESESAMERARKQVADLIGADPREIVFTSGATESNNMAIKYSGCTLAVLWLYSGVLWCTLAVLWCTLAVLWCTLAVLVCMFQGVARFYGQKRRHVITTQTEHKCVLDSCRVLESEGFSVTYLPVQNNGLVDLELLERSIRSDTSLVSIMTINNEIGVKQPIREIGRLCRSRGVFFHTDGAQAVGKIPLNVTELNVDLMSISGHKIYGPKGVGALFVRRRPRVRLEPLQSGGGQERGLRSGTVPTPLAVGLGAACRIARDELQYDHQRVSALAQRLIQKITSQIPDVILNGDLEQRYPGCVNLSFAYVEGESLLMALKDVALSSGRYQNQIRTRPGPEPDPDQTRTRTGPGPDQDQTRTRSEPDPDQNRTRTRPEPGPGPDPNQDQDQTRTRPEPDQNQTRTRPGPDQRLHVCVSGAVLRPESHRSRRRPGPLLHQVRYRAVHDGGGGGLHGAEVCAAGAEATRDESSVGDGPGGNRHQEHQVDSALELCTNQEPRLLKFPPLYM